MDLYKRIKDMTAFLIAGILVLTMLSCSYSEGADQTSQVPAVSVEESSSVDPVTEQESKSEPESVSTEASSGYSDALETVLAKRYGITMDNYPILDGSTSTRSIVSSLYNVFFNIGEAGYEGSKLPGTPSKTVPSYRKLIQKEADMIFVPYASSAVLQEAKDHGVELEFHRIAAEALVFITHADNTAENITRDQVREIYLNYGIRNWKELGGPDKELVPICRNADSGSQSQMDNLILGNEAMHPEILDHYLLPLMWDVLEAVAYYQTGGFEEHHALNRDCYALGYSLFTYVEDAVRNYGMSGLKYLSYEGVAPSEESILNGTYTLSDGYYAVLRADTPADHPARKLLEFLQSEEGQKMLESVNMLPAPETEETGPSGGYLDPDNEGQAERQEEQEKKDLADLSALLERFGESPELNPDTYSSVSSWLLDHRDELIEKGIPSGRIAYYWTLLQRLNNLARQ